jgi:hypothetical protein
MIAELHTPTQDLDLALSSMAGIIKTATRLLSSWEDAWAHASS